MERGLNVTKHCLNFIKNGKRRAIDADLRFKLYNVTGLEEFKHKIEELRSKPNAVKRNIPKGAKTLPQIMARESKKDYYKQANKIKKLLVSLTHELEYFKQAPESSRETFRKVVPGIDVGYITTLLRALYNEDQFQRWMLFSEYKMKSEE